MILVSFSIIHGHIPSEFPDQEHYVIVDFTTAKIQQGLLADKKREGRCSGDYFVFNACEIHFWCFIEALDSKGT